MNRSHLDGPAALAQQNQAATTTDNHASATSSTTKSTTTKSLQKRSLATNTLRPNTSLNHRTRYGGLSWPGLGYAVHFPNPSQAIPPQRSD
jgi:hypothetical protein